MEKNDLIKFCRYYKGEDVCPFLNDLIIRRIAWEVEKTWVDEYLLIEKDGDHAITPNIDKWVESCNHYVPAGQQIPGDAPRFLKAAIFSLFLYKNELPIFDDFLHFYDKWSKKEL